MKRRLITVGIVLAGYLAIYLISRQVFALHSPHYLYTPEWTARNVLWIAAIVSTVPALLGARLFPFVTLGGYVLGVVAGELFGGFEADVPPQYLHWGWLIWLGVFLASVGAGVVVEKVHKRRRLS